MQIRPLDCTKKKPTGLQDKKIRFAIGIIGFIIGVYFTIKLIIRINL